MLRWLSFFGAVALVAAGVVFYIYGGPPRPLIEPPRYGVDPPEMPVALADVPRPAPAGLWDRENVGVTPLVVVRDSRLIPWQSPQVPSMRDGQLLFLGTEIKSKRVEKDKYTLLSLPDGAGGEKEVKVEDGKNPPAGAFKAEIPYLVTEAQAEDRKPGDVKPGDDAPEGWVLRGKWYRPLGNREIAQPNRVRLHYAEKWFLPLDEGTKVQEGQVIGLIDPALAVADLNIKLAKLNAAEADRVAAEKTRDEAKKRWDRADMLWRKGSEALEAVQAAQLGYERYVSETVSKTEGVKTAAQELRQSDTVLDLHMIRSKINGEVKQLVKHKGESVKNLDAVLEMIDYSKLRIRGRADLHDLPALRQSPVVDVEVTRHVGPALILTGHMGEVTGVAVSKDRQVVSVSEDKTARVWAGNLTSHRERLVLRHPAGVRAVACTPPGAKDNKANLCLTGAADGVARLYNLDPDLKGDPFVRQFRDANGHKEAINAVAFSPDGQWAATGGDDRFICLWDVGTGKLLHRFPADRGHHGGVTSVQFLSDDGKKPYRLVSAGRDNALIVWPLEEDGTPQEEPTRFDRRGGEVTTLGVNPRGGQVLFDQGKELRILSPANGALVGTLSATGAGGFTKLALFSPNGDLVLAGGGGGRLQLWRAPTPTARGHELQQLVWASGRDEQAATNCGAFAPPGGEFNGFLVTGTQNRSVIVWPMPSEKEVEKPLTARIINLDPEVSSGQVRVTAELDNADGRLLPGDVVTMVVYPPKQKKE
jgi:WD40 repeat protein